MRVSIKLSIALLAWVSSVAGCVIVVEDGNIEILNNTGVNVDVVNVRVGFDWGDNYLFPGEILASGDSVPITGFEPADWDVRLIDVAGDEYEIHNIRVRAGSTTLVTVDRGDCTTCDSRVGTGNLIVYNDIDWGDQATQFWELYVTRSTRSFWGGDLLSGLPAVNYGESVEVFDLVEGDYDIQVVDERGDFYEVYDVPVSTNGVTHQSVTVDELID